MLAFQMDTEGTTIKDILLVEDDPHDAELALAALGDRRRWIISIAGGNSRTARVGIPLS